VSGYGNQQKKQQQKARFRSGFSVAASCRFENTCFQSGLSALYSPRIHGLSAQVIPHRPFIHKSSNLFTGVIAMGQPHVSDIPLHGSIESTLRQGALDGVIVAGDLTSEAAAVAAVAADQAKAHVADKPRHESVKEAVKLLDRVEGSTALETGASLDNVYTAVKGGDWPRGLSPAM
jgi:hypothetical protein